MANKFKKGDKVKVISGKNKGALSEILSFDPKKNTATVSKVNIAKKHKKPSKNDPKGGIIEKEMPLHVSNIMHVNSKTKAAERVGFMFLKNGKKVRFLKKSGELIDNTKA